MGLFINDRSMAKSSADPVDELNMKLQGMYLSPSKRTHDDAQPDEDRLSQEPNMVLSPSKRHRTKQVPMLAQRRSSKLCQAVCDISFDGHIFIPHMFICKHQIVYSNKIMS